MCRTMKELENVVADYRSLKAMKEQLEEELKVLSEDCKALTNRCFVLTRGSMCMFCELHGYRCDRAMSYSEKIEATKNLMEVVTNAEN